MTFRAFIRFEIQLYFAVNAKRRLISVFHEIYRKLPQMSATWIHHYL